MPKHRRQEFSARVTHLGCQVRRAVIVGEFQDIEEVVLETPEVKLELVTETQETVLKR